MKARLLLCATLSLAAVSFAAELTEEFHQTYALAANGRITVKNVNGEVRVTAWDSPQVKVDAIKRGDDREALDNARIVVDPRSDEIDIRTKYPEDSCHHHCASVDYTITVPRGASLASIGTVNGGVTIEGVTGPVKAASVNGNVEVRGAANDLKASTVNGHVHADFQQFAARMVHVTTVNGAIELGLPANAGGHLNATTVTGNIDSDFELPVRHARFAPGATLQSTFGGGTAEMRLSTVSGNIELRKR